jgi:hypothetical protein
LHLPSVINGIARGSTAALVVNPVIPIRCHDLGDPLSGQRVHHAELSAPTLEVDTRNEQLGRPVADNVDSSAIPPVRHAFRFLDQVSTIGMRSDEPGLKAC